MSDTWKIASTPITGTPEEQREQEKALRDKLSASLDTTVKSLEHWQGKQDEYTKRIIDIVSQTLAVGLYFGSVASGVGGVGLIPLFAAKAAIASTVENIVKRALSRQGDLPTRDMIKNILTSNLASIPATAAIPALGSLPSAASVAIRGQIGAIANAVVGGIAGIIGASGPGDLEISFKAFKDNVVEKLKDYNLTDEKVYKTALTAISIQVNGYVTDAIKADLIQSQSTPYEDMSPAQKEQLGQQAKYLQTLHKNAYNIAMNNKGYHLLAAFPVHVANLPFPETAEPDKNKLEEQQKKWIIGNTLVQLLADKGLKVDDDFDYSDIDKLLEQIDDKLPLDGQSDSEKAAYKSDLTKMRTSLQNSSTAIIDAAKTQADSDITLQQKITDTRSNDAIIRTAAQSGGKTDYGRTTPGSSPRDAAVASIRKLLIGKRLQKMRKQRQEGQQRHRRQLKRSQLKKRRSLAA